MPEPAESDQATPTHPRPQLRRPEWASLDGPWDFALDPEARWTTPGEVAWGATIRVPFAPETPASGISDTGFYRACWYRRTFEPPDLSGGRRLILHFGAIDFAATVWVNGAPAARHEGGYTPFQADVTDLLRPGGPQEVVVRAGDDPHDLAKPRGKQDWQLDPHAIWYPRTTGIWQPVWMEAVPATRIGALRWTPSLRRWEIGLDARVDGDGPWRGGLRLAVTLRAGGQVLVEDAYAVVAGEVRRGIALSDPGIDDFRNELLWSPERPHLIEAELRLLGLDGAVLDAVSSYTALRSIGVQGDRFVLNGRAYPLRLVLDQGYWPETGLSAPDEAALRRDVGLAKAMGFNGVRKHQKVEDPRYLYWADVLGLLVWEEMPSAYRYTRESVERVTREWIEVVRRDASHPCVVAWVPFNESWGVPDLPDSPAQRHYVQAIYHLTRTLDPTRPVVGNDGWESMATDIIGIHDYDDDPSELVARYGGFEELDEVIRRERPGGRILTVEGHGYAGHPLVLSEFGGIRYDPDDSEATWGYSAASTAEELAARYAELLAAVRSLSTLAGFCYTQFADTYQEANGLLRADRTPKFPLEQIAEATRGVVAERDRLLERRWRKKMMEAQQDRYGPPRADHPIEGDRY